MAFGTAGRRLTMAAATFAAAIAVPAASTSLSASAQTRRAVHGAADERAAAPAGRDARALAGRDGRVLAGRIRHVSYRGYVFAIPAGWPVISLAAHPGTCVRFDRHALYLGTPGARQACPAGLVGATEAVAVAPAGTRQASRAAEDPAARRFTATAPRITVTATYHRDRAQVLAVLASAGLPRPFRQNVAAMAAERSRRGPAALPPGATEGSGFGFDACAAPGPRIMRAWLAHSHYRSIGVYIGGSDRACAQPNLTAAWASQQAAAGWHFFPLYVGPQAAFGEIPVGSAHAMGVSAAQDAAVQAQQLGFGTGAPIYYDMEAYAPGATHAALKFISAWTAELHTLGYRSAVYSSSSSGIADLANNYNSSAYRIPDVIDDAWWNGAANTRDPNIPAGEWASHQRIHQFSGNVNQTRGGYTLNIDQDFLDVGNGGSGGGGGTGGGGGGGGAGPTRQASQAVALRHGALDAFFAGADGALWLAARRPHSGWHAPASLGGTLASPPSAVAGVGGAIDVFYRGTDGGLWMVSRAGKSWSQPKQLNVGPLGGPPAAVSDAFGDVEVFWRGSDTAQLWAVRYLAGRGWQRPHHLAHGVASDPSPAVSGARAVSVFWKGTGGQLWYATHSISSPWRSAAITGMGTAATGPRAAGQRNGDIDVVWGGTGGGSVWQVTYRPGAGWAAPSRIARGRTGDPIVVASSGRTAEAVWQGAGGGLWCAARATGGWGPAGAAGLGNVGGGVFAASKGGGIVDVFWTGSSSPALWHGRYHPASQAWTGPDELGGSVG